MKLLKSRGAVNTVYCLLLCSGLVSTLCIFFMKLQFAHMGFMLTMVLLGAGVFAAIALAAPPKAQGLSALVLLLLWLVAGFFLRRVLAAGAQVAAGYVIPELHRIVNYVFATPPRPTPAGQWYGAFFCAWALLPWACLLAWVVAGKKSGLGALLLTLPFFVFAYCLAGPPTPLWMVLQFAFWFAMLLQPKRPVRAGGAGAAIPAVSYLLAAAVLAGLFAAVPAAGFKAGDSILSIRDGIVNFAVDFEFSGFFRGLTGFSSGTPMSASDGNVNLNATGNLRFATRNVMQVYAEYPQDLYLRGYAAAEYTGSGWLQDTAAFEAGGFDIQPLAYLQRDDFYTRYMAPGRIEVVPEQKNGNFLWMPYLLAGVTEANPAPEWQGDAYLAADGQERYAFTSYGGIDYATYVEGINRNNYNPYLGSLEAVTIEREGTMMEFYRTSGGPMPSLLYSWVAGDMDEDMTEEEQARIVEAFEAYQYFLDAPPDEDFFALFYPSNAPDAEYMRFIQEEYTALPDGLADSLLAWWNSLAAVWSPGLESYGFDSSVPWYEMFYRRDGLLYFGEEKRGLDGNIPYWGWGNVAQVVAEGLRSWGTYNTHPGAQPRNRDFVEYFLYESGTGYCVHFASATVALLRAMGIPARYAEGYVVGEDSFGADGWATVPAKNAHAWAEVWIPQVGWMPVDATPGSSVASNIFSLTAPETAEREPNVDEPEAELRDQLRERMEQLENSVPTPGQQQATSTPNAGADGPTAVVAQRRPSTDLLITLITVLGWAAVGSGLLFGSRWLVRRRRAARFAGTDRNQAALHIYAHWQSFAKPPRAATELAMKARFSPHAISKEELAALRREMETARQHTLVGAEGLKRILLWIRVV